MKTLIFPIICLALLLSAGNIYAQSKTRPSAELTRLIHHMGADTNDTWSNAGWYPNKFDVWVKQKPADNPLNTFAHFAVYNDIMLAQLHNYGEMELATTAITRQNADKYLYHVVANDSVELVPWTKVSHFRANKFISYAYLGKFNCRGKIIKLEIYEINNYLNRAVYIYNCDYTPNAKITNVVLHYNFTPKLNKRFNTMITDSGEIINQQLWHKGFNIKMVNNVKYMAIRIKNTLQNSMYYVYLKRTIDTKTDTVFITNNWNYDFYNPDPVAAIGTSYFNKPGKYEVLIMRERFNDLNGSLSAIKFRKEDDKLLDKISFTVLPGPITLPVKTVSLIILILLTTGGFMFFMYRDQQKRKLAKAAQNRQIATLQLASVRAQLNPHFIFNALAGIQNLMNKKEVENANKYLSRFARLTRNVLDDGQKELVTIGHETDLLKDYLEMEQMRFGFKFKIDVEAYEIDQQIEIPAMLLQPFAENAVKHGVSSLKEEGMIRVGITKKDNSLLLTVQDNGKGFSAKQSAGMGMKLCEERIKLLNSIYKNSTILLHQTSGSGGTTITIELKNWV